MTPEWTTLPNARALILTLPIRQAMDLWAVYVPTEAHPKKGVVTAWLLARRSERSLLSCRRGVDTTGDQVRWELAGLRERIAIARAALSEDGFDRAGCGHRVTDTVPEMGGAPSCVPCSIPGWDG